MALADVLSGIGTVAQAVGKRTADVVSGEAPKLDEEQRKRSQTLEDAALAAKSQALEQQLQMGQKYGTLTPEQQQQYVDQITGLYKDPRHAGTLMEKLRQAVHPDGAYAQGPQAPLPNATPQGGTAAQDEANAEKLAASRGKAQQAKKGFDQFLEAYSRDNQLDPTQLTEAQLEDAHTKYYQQTHQQMLDKEIVEDPSSPTGFSVSELDRRTGKQVSSFQGVRPPAGFVPKHRVSHSIDQYGNETTTVSDITPVLGKPGGGVGSSTGAKTNVGSILGASRPTTGAKPVGQGGPSKSVLPKQATQAAGLDQNGHIPSGRGNPQVVELANELLDGRESKDLPMKARAAAEAMARQYGWEQGTFTPKEKILINEAGAKLQQLHDSPSLKVLNSTMSRNKIAQVLASADKEGTIGKAISATIAGHLTKEEQEFVRDYNAAVGVISGLAPLTRGGRPTEASIHRLMQELPSVLQSGDADDAKARIQQLLGEIRLAAGSTGRTPITVPQERTGVSNPPNETITTSGDAVEQFLKNF